MVERLKKAIAKAHAERVDREAALDRASKPSLVRRVADANAARLDLTKDQLTDPASIDELWASISPLEIDKAAMDRSRVVSFAGQHPARISFDILRTRLTKMLRENDWSRLAVTSSTKGEGKTFVSLNLAMSLARNRDNRVMLLDLDLRAPGLSRVLHTREALFVDEFLHGEIDPRDYFRSIEDNLIVGLNSRIVPNSAELIQSETAETVLNATIDFFQPTIVIYDLPPIMVSDDTIGVLDYADGALLVAAAGETNTREIAESERLILEHTNLLGIILNKGEQTDTKKYYY